MPKKPDKSEQVRIRSTEAEMIREVSERLGISFLDALYRMVNYYCYLNPPSLANSPIITALKPEIKLDQAKENRESEDDELELDLDDFA